MAMYSFESEDNRHKWRGLFSVAQTLTRVHPTLHVTDDAITFIESLALQLLAQLLSEHAPHSVADVEERVARTFPPPLDKWAVRELREARARRGRHASVDRLHALLQKEVLGHKLDVSVAHALFAVVDFVVTDVVQLSGRFVINCRHVEVSRDDVRVAMCADHVLMEMFHATTHADESAPDDEDAPLAYEDVVKQIVTCERHFVRDLNLIIKVFRDPLARIADPPTIDAIFGCIDDVHDLSVALLASLEDVLEAARDTSDSCVGIVFEEIAECAEFDVYERFATDVLPFPGSSSQTTLHALLSRDSHHALQSSGVPLLAFRHALPRLLLAPVTHVFSYFDHLRLLRERAPTEEDRESLQQAEGLLQPLKSHLERVAPKQTRAHALRLHRVTNRACTLSKLRELSLLRETCAGAFVTEGIVQRVQNNKRLSERHAFLFEGMFVLAKAVHARRTSMTNDETPLWRLKERFPLRQIEVNDSEEENAFEVATRQEKVTLVARNHEEKCAWMAHLILLSTRAMLERTLDSLLADEEKQHPLKLPSPAVYRFAEEDVEGVNIVFEDARDDARAVPVIRGATLLKLVERLTFHQYADPMFVRLFLTTFRSFCTPQQLISLLTERFEIPDPEDSQREVLKRFRKEYQQPVQFRVLNVLRHWIDHHYYDFERDPTLLRALNVLLEDKVRARNMRKWVESIRKILARKSEVTHVSHTFASSPPTIEWHLTRDPEKFDLLTLHPVEFARQLTLLEFELYRAVTPSELIGSGAGESLVWTRKDKARTSPNLMRMIHHSDNFIFWLNRAVVETQNLEERVAIVQRIIEIMIVMNELNNFTGVLECLSSLNSACVHRLEHTMNAVSSRLKKALDEAKELSEDHFRKYHEKLRSINPPCVPFFGNYLTNILHIEEGNSDFLHNNLINFAKRRKVAEITAEIQQYQNQPYCLTLVPEIRTFVTSLDAFQGKEEKELNDYLYGKSLEIEPRGAKQCPKFPRRYPDLSLKSPGIKTRSRIPAPLESLRNSLSSSHPHPESGGESNSPSTPLTPPHSANNCVFAHVLIGSTPPPLPPRRLRNASLREESPPPLPPKNAFFSTLPQRQRNNQIPRRNSAQELSNGPFPAPPPVPPKTHKIRN